MISSVLTHEESKLNAIIISLIAIAVNGGRAYLDDNDHFAYPTIRTLVNSRVGLPCNVTLSSPSDAVTLILWYRGSYVTGAPIYSVDARESGRISNGKHFVGDSLTSRAKLDLSLPSFGILFIDSVLESDDGRYWCRVDFRWTRTTISSVTLEVIVPSKRITVRDAMNGANLINGSFITINEGSGLRLICDSFGGRPLSVVNWYRNSLIIDDTYAPIQSTVNGSTAVVRNELLIGNASRAELNDELRCQASNSNLTIPLEIHLAIDLNLRPLTVEIIDSELIDLKADQESKIVCQSIGSRPSAQLVWLLTKPYGLTTDVSKFSLWHNSDNKSESVLKFVPTFADNGSELRCRAINYLMANFTIETAIRLNVKFAPVITLSFGSVISSDRAAAVSRHIAEGSEILLHCGITCNPDVSSISWTHNGQQLRNNDSLGIIIANYNTTLIVSSASRDMTGDYHCVGRNSVGSTRSNDIQIEVLYSPKCVTAQTDQPLIGKVGDYLTFECNVTARPTNVTFHWSLQNGIDSDGDGRSQRFSVRSSGLQSYAKYQIEDFADFGRVSCWASNQIGDQSEPCVWNVSAAAVDESGNGSLLRECLINASFNTIIIQCRNDADSDVTSAAYHLQLYDHKSGALLRDTINFTNPLFIVTDLSASTTYSIRLWSTGRPINQIQSSRLLVVRTKSIPGGETDLIVDSLRFPLTTGHRFLLLGVALMCALVVTVLLVIVMRKLLRTVMSRRHRRKITEKCDSKLLDCSLMDMIGGDSGAAGDQKRLCNGDDNRSATLSAYCGVENGKTGGYYNKGIIRLCCDDESSTSYSNRSSSTLETVATIENQTFNCRKQNYYSTPV